MTPAAAVHNLGILLNSTHVDEFPNQEDRVNLFHCAEADFLFYSPFSVQPVVQSLVTSLILSRLDYGNATLAGIPQHLLRRLQSVMNATA